MKLISFFTHQPFWGVLTLAVLLWYSTVTLYVAVRGALDIRAMLIRLRQNRAEPSGTPSDHDTATDGASGTRRRKT